MSEDVSISAQVTPNPHTLKFMIDRDLVESGTFNFTDFSEAEGSVLPEAVFGIDGVTGVMVGRNFVSVSKSTDVDWSQLASDIIASLKSVIAAGEPYIDAALAVEEAANDSEVVVKIKSILDNEIRPAVAMDGGDILFHSYEDGILTLSLQGACSSCPSSVMTLKMGVEARLKEDIPELREVIQV